MNKHRIVHHSVLGDLPNHEEICFTFNEKKYIGYEGDTIASALMANGIRKLRVHEESGTPRGIYCNIGHCFECRVSVDGKSGIRACLTLLQGDMVIESGEQLDAPFKSKSVAKQLPRTYSEFKKQTKKERQMI